MTVSQLIQRLNELPKDLEVEFALMPMGFRAIVKDVLFLDNEFVILTNDGEIRDFQEDTQ